MDLMMTTVMRTPATTASGVLTGADGANAVHDTGATDAAGTNTTPRPP
jgi:hypothetical protein